MHDDYKPLETPAGVERCPVCGSEAQLWQYSDSPNSPVKRLVMCSHGDKIGPQNGLIHEGCLLYMPGDDFYRETARDAVRFWNEFAKALSTLRRQNNWQHAQVLRGPAGVEGGSMSASAYLAKVEADPRRAAALQRARDRTAGVAERDPRCGYPYCACVGQCFAASQPGATAGVATDGGGKNG